MLPRKIAAVTFLSSIAVAALCWAQDKSKPDSPARCTCGEAENERQRLAVAVQLATPVPLNPFADVKVGDWWLYSMKTLAGEKGALHGTIVWRVTEQDGDDVRVSEETTGDGKGWLVKSCWFNQKEAPAIASVMLGGQPGLVGGRITAFAFTSGVLSTLPTLPPVIEEKRRASGESFAAKKISWVQVVDDTNPFQPEPSRVSYTSSIWMSAEARSSIIALETKLYGTDDSKVSIELAGYGSGERADWGRAPERK
jgi:hypothetical protein